MRLFGKKQKAPRPISDEEKQITKKNRKKVSYFWKRIPTPIRKALIAFIVIIGLTGLFSVAAFGWYTLEYVDPTMDLGNIDSSLDYTSVVYATNASGKVVEIEQLHKDENRIWVGLDEIPDNLQWAFIAIEDRRFYQHDGVDWIRTGGAIINMVKGGSTYGGSTITQQLIKNLTGDNDVKVSRKVQEIRRALYLEKEYNKSQILEAYLNTIYLSQGCNGVQTAARVYFGKDVKDLTLAECASLAAITNLPSKYDPYISDTTRDNNKERQEIILNEMVKIGKITEEEAKKAKEQKLVFKNASGKSEQSRQSYFVEAMIDQVIEDLVEQKGYSYSYASRMVYSGGLSIYSTQEIDTQAILDEAYKNTSTFTYYELAKNSKDETPQSAMVILNNKTGAVAALTGGRGEKTINRGLNRATMSYRQPGSCMKPIGTYAPAFEYNVKINGSPISPGTMVMDASVTGNWPVNYDVITNKPMSVQTAIAHSTNTVAVRVNMALGASRAFKFLRENLGITSMVDEKDENSAVTALGGMTKGITTLEIAAAYETFPNGGTYIRPYYYTKVVDSNGKVLLNKTPESHTAMSSSTAAMINMLLQYAATSGTGSPANFGTTAIAGKTGTTSDSKDRYFVGYTAYYTAAVWYGYDYPTRINYSGTNPAVSAWRKVMSQIHQGYSYKSFDVPSNLISVQICSESGMLATEECVKAEKAISGQFIAGSQPTQPCTVHVPEVPEEPEQTEQENKEKTEKTEKKPDKTKPAEQTKPETKPEEKPIEEPNVDDPEPVTPGDPVEPTPEDNGETEGEQPSP